MADEPDITQTPFTNIDLKPFVGVWGGKETTFKPGETKEIAAFLAEHYTGHLIDQITIREDDEANKGRGKDEPKQNHYGDEPYRADLAKRIRAGLVTQAPDLNTVKEEKKDETLVERLTREDAEKKEELRKKRAAILVKARAARDAKIKAKKSRGK